MNDRVYPSTKPNGAAAANPTVAPPLPTPPAKYNPNRHPYRPTPTTRHRQKTRKFSCRRCCCLTCFWSILLLTLILLIAAIAAAAFYVLYHPHRPVFSVTALKIATFNLTTTPADDSTHLTSKINVTLSAKNPNNKKILYTYDPMLITVFSRSVILSNSSYAGFNSSAGSVSVIHTAMAAHNQVLDADSLKLVNSDLKRRNGLPVRIVVDTTVGVKMDKLKTKKIGIRVTCDGIHGIVPKGKTVIPAKTTDADCKVDLRIKILKWTF